MAKLTSLVLLALAIGGMAYGSSGGTGGYAETLAISLDATSQSDASTTQLGADSVSTSKYNSIFCFARLTGATGGTLDVYIQRKVGGQYYDFIHFTQKAAGSAISAQMAGSVSYQGQGLYTVNTVDGTPAMSANVGASGPTDNIRRVFVTGGGTTAGAAQDIECILQT